jgi:hypothetical protein
MLKSFAKPGDAKKQGQAGLTQAHRALQEKTTSPAA